ncbi:MAG: hypothetical protein JST82_07155 [Bacteroidetes bacterium]|nr:hypothetical protein [Bacteroidota bacterium]
MKRQYFIAGLLAVLALASCDPFGYNKKKTNPQPVKQPPAEVDGWAPVYNTDPANAEIKSMPPRNIDKGGKIYVKGDTLYEVEAGKGIHVILINQPQNPQKIAFINVLGAQEVAIKNNVLYTNNINDLVALDITNTSDVKTIDRISNVFHLVDVNYPPGTGYFECVDKSKGTVVGWETKTLNYPKCSR